MASQLAEAVLSRHSKLPSSTQRPVTECREVAASCQDNMTCPGSYIGSQAMQLEQSSHARNQRYPLQGQEGPKAPFVICPTSATLVHGQEVIPPTISLGRRKASVKIAPDGSATLNMRCLMSETKACCQV